MRMWKQELKKIWNWRIVAVLTLLAVVYYSLFLSFFVKYFPNGPLFEGIDLVGKELVARYGVSLDAEEAAEAWAGIPAVREEYGDYVKNHEIGQRYGLKSYDDFNAFYDENVYGVSGELTDEEQERYKDANILMNYLEGEETNDVDGRLYGWELFKERYQVWGEAAAADASERAACLNVEIGDLEPLEKMYFGGQQAPGWQSILPNETVETTWNYMGWLLIWMVFSACLLISPLLVRDKMRGMEQLQWASRQGRGILKSQLAAALISVLVLSAANLAVLGGIFFSQGVMAYRDCKMTSFVMFSTMRVDWTYGAWVFVLVMIALLMTVGISLTAFFLSRCSNHYVAMLFKLIPLLVVGAALCKVVMTKPFAVWGMVYQVLPVGNIELVLAMAALVLGAGLCVAAVRQQKRRQLL